MQATAQAEQPLPAAAVTKKIAAALSPAAVPTAILPVPHQVAGSGTIVQTGQAPFPAAVYTFQNHWYEVKNKQYIIVYAGALTNNPVQGLLVEETTSLNYSSVTAPATYLAPSQSGSLQIVAAHGELLTLQSAKGLTLQFDVPSGKFIQP
jgi:hypothetical protein